MGLTGVFVVIGQGTASAEDKVSLPMKQRLPDMAGKEAPC